MIDDHRSSPLKFTPLLNTIILAGQWTFTRAPISDTITVRLRTRALVLGRRGPRCGYVLALADIRKVWRIEKGNSEPMGGTPFFDDVGVGSRRNMSVFGM